MAPKGTTLSWRQPSFGWTISVWGVFLAICGTVTSLAQSPEIERQITMSRRVDELLNEHLKQIGWEPAERCSDAAFIRRAYLDLTGTPPTGAEVMRFLRDQDSTKRQKLIDRLLASPISATHLANTWADWLLPEEANLPVPPGQDGLRNWLRMRFAENLRYDRLVSDLMVAAGPAPAGPTQFFLALEGKPEKIAAKTARVFLGVQLDCAECHDHPFDDWSQRDFWGFAAYFARLSTEATPAMAGAGQVVDLAEGEVMLPGTDEVVAPTPLIDTGLSELGFGTRRQQLTLWLTAQENPFLARATVNRVWALLFGRGLIEPVDDMRDLQLASHPELLAELSDYFAETGFDLRDLLSTLAKTEAYSRATIHTSGSAPVDSYAVMPTKPLTARQLANSLASVAREVNSGDARDLDALIQQLGRLRGDASQAKLGMVGALVSLHGRQFDVVSREQTSRLLKALEAPHLGTRGQFRWLFLSTLNRPPSREEEIAFSAFLGDSTVSADSPRNRDRSPKTASETGGRVSPRQAAAQDRAWQSDLLWALINSTEFAMTP